MFFLILIPVVLEIKTMLVHLRLKTNYPSWINIYYLGFTIYFVSCNYCRWSQEGESPYLWYKLLLRAMITFYSLLSILWRWGVSLICFILKPRRLAFYKWKSLKQTWKKTQIRYRQKIKVMSSFTLIVEICVYWQFLLR